MNKLINSKTLCDSIILSFKDHILFRQGQGFIYCVSLATNTVPET